MNTKTLHIDISSYWHAGTGAGQGALLDSVVEKNDMGLPYLPGRTLKGILRDAVFRWEQLGGYEQHNLDMGRVTNLLFGVWGDDGNTTTQGMIRVGSANMDTHFMAAITQHQDARKLINYLYAEHFSTKIDDKTGVAVDQSLRGSELTIPMSLYADISVVEHDNNPITSMAFDLLAQAFPMVQAVGKQKNRGLGRTELSWK
jgi:CRISPR/Cas system CSM-associated protein Csm3 (group 7 of RAMP superfamily)